MNTITITIVLLLVFCLLLWLFRKKAASVTAMRAMAVPGPVAAVVPVVKYTRLYEADVETETDSGRRFRRVTMQKATPRLTYLKGMLRGKFWAETEEDVAENVYTTRYQFRIYEVMFWVNSEAGISRGIPFSFEEDFSFPSHKLPATIPCHLIMEGSSRHFGIELHDPRFSKVAFVHKLQQEDGKELFGTIETEATGYILDDIKEEYEEIEYLPELTKAVADVNEQQHGYEGRNDTYAQRPARRIVRYTPSGDFYHVFATVITWGIFLLFILALIPRLVLLLPFLAVLLLFYIIPVVVWEWVLKAALLLWVLFWINLLVFSPAKQQQSSLYPRVTDYDSVVTVPQSPPVAAATDGTPRPPADSLIWHYRKWYDYKGKLYEGRYYVKTKDYQSAHQWKNNISVSGPPEASYDYMLYLLKEHDKGRLSGLYRLFDSIKAANTMDSVRFAEVIVSFVQQIPYCLVLEKDCSPVLYADAFIRNYLQSENARCDGHERFGINSPVEFVATSKGDCDSRTLLLYALLRHYGYQVAVLSSEYYNHSVLGIRLPLQGQAYYYKNEPYYCWETTAAGIPAGVMAKEVGNLNYWRLSLIAQ